MSGRRSWGIVGFVMAALALGGSSSAPAESAAGPVRIDPRQSAVSAEASFLEDRGRVSLIELTGDYDRTVDGSFNGHPRTLVAREFFRRHPDRYDFLIVFSSFDFDTGGFDAFHLPVQNRVQGIGLPLFDDTDLFGSDGRLQGYIDMSALDEYVTDPLEPGFERSLEALTHEILHQWGAYVRIERADGTRSDALLGRDGSHWSFLLDTDASLLYGNDWRDEGNGIFTSTGVRKFYSPLDLYLAGFLRPEEVPPFVLIEGSSADPNQLPRSGAEVRGTARVVTVDDVIAAEGPRAPAAARAQKRFRAAFVMVVRPGETVDDAQIAGLDRLRRGLMDRFAALTGGRGVLEVFPEVAPGVDPGEPGGIGGGGPVRSTEASLLDGLAWLRGAQTDEGYWEDRPGTRPRDTTAALGVLAALDPSFSGGDAAIQWLSARDESTTDFLARAIPRLTDAGRATDAEREALVASQNPDGGWGLASDYASDPGDTALAVLALADAPETPVSTLTDARDYLLAVQGPDGGWGNTSGGAGRTGVTATVLEALAASGGGSTAVDAGAVFLASRQNPDGGFGDSPSTAHDTAAVLRSLIASGRTGAVDAPAATAYLRSRQTEAGSWGGSVYSTARAVSALKTFRFPNWSFVGEPTVEPAAPRDGERVRLRYEVANDGNRVTPAGVLRLFEGDPDDGGVAVTDVEIPPIGARGSVVASLLWDSRDRAGTNRLVALLDPDGAVEELSELDNRSVVAVDVAPAPQEADLEVTPDDVVISPERPVELPASLGISVTVRNLGQTDVDEATVRLLRGTGEDAVALAEIVVAVPQRSSSPVSFSHTLESPGVTVFTVRVDPSGAVAEADETNNEASRSVATAASVDPAVADADLELSGTPFVGTDVTLTATIHNRGTTATPEVPIRFTVGDGTDTRVIGEASASIEGGSSVERTATWRVELAGTLMFGVELDPEGLIPESDETNNRASLQADTAVVEQPDLVLDHEELTFEPDPALEGSPVTLSAVLRNVGGSPVADATVSFFGGDPDQGAAPIGAPQVVPELAAGEAATVEVTTEPLPDASERLIYAVADPDDRVAEFDESDNSAFRTLEVLSLPDLAVSPADLAVEPALPEPGAQVTTTVEVANFGNREAPDAVVRLTGDGAPLGSDRVLTVPAGGSAEAVFTWTFPDGADAVLLEAVADPAGTLAEGSESNNRAAREVFVFDQDRPVVPRYISPNGDGVQDTAVYTFTLPAASTVTVEVIDEEGAVVRSHAGPGLTDVTRGRFEWDGLDASGLVVDDGDYLLAAVDGTGRRLDAAPVTVDTDRSPLFDALGTPFERITNLTCDLLDVDDVHITSADTEALFAVDDFMDRDPETGEVIGDGGIYESSTGSGHPRRLIPASYPSADFSLDGQKVAYRYDFDDGDLTLSDTDGSDVETIPNVRPFRLVAGFLGGTRDLLFVRYGSGRGDSLVYRPADGPERTLVQLGSDEEIRTLYPSPDGANALFRVDSSSRAPLGGWRVVNVETAEVTPLEFPPLEFDDDPSAWFFRWTPDGGRFLFSLGQLVWDNPTGWTDGWAVFAADGEFQRLILPRKHTFADIDAFDEFGPVPPPERQTVSIGEGSFSPSGGEFVFRTDYDEYKYGSGSFIGWDELVRADLATGELETVEWLGPFVWFFSYHVEVREAGGWTRVGELHYGMGYAEQRLELTGHLPDAEGEYKVRIRQVGLQAGHADRVRLETGGRFRVDESLTPATAELSASGEDVLTPLLVKDRDVVDLHERTVELRWPEPAPEPGGDLWLALVAREEDLSDRDARPFTYPSDDGASYHHVIGSGAPMSVDGRQTGADGLEEPLFAEWSRPDTGHPAATVYGYVGSDDEFLYGALDFTVDNTQDGERDWASLSVETPDGWRELRITASDRRWGEVGFTRTGRVHHRHKYYEFRIPLDEIDAQPGETVALRFRGYGTAALLPEDDYLPKFGDPLWLPGGDTILYQTDGATWLVDADGEERPQRIFEQFNTLEAGFLETFEELYVSRSEQTFLFLDGRDILDPESACYNPSDYAESSYFAFQTLANDSVDLRGEPTADGRGILLSGTATDLHFRRWRLEYADQEVPDFWTPVTDPVATPAVEEELATWIPPRPGEYLVRLTVEDLAGNSRSIVRRFASSSSSPTSITDVRLSPRYISPDGDGVQDRASLRYRVLAPVHLEIDVLDEDGDRVRRIQRDHGTVGSEHEVVWAGRDDSGLPVPDGRYRVEIQGYAFPVTVDTVAPEIAGIEPVGPGTIVRVRGTDRSVRDLGPAVAWCAADEHPAPSSGRVAIGEGAEPASWDGLLQAGSRETCGVREDWPRRAVSLSRFVGHRFRLEVRDLAGNSAVGESGFAEETLYPYRLREHPPGADGAMLREHGIPALPSVTVEDAVPLRLRLAETVRDPLSRLFLRFQPVCGPATDTPCWDAPQEIELTQLFEAGETLPASGVPESRIDVVWDPAILDPDLDWTVELRARTVGGRDVVSGPLELRFRTDALYFRGLATRSTLPSEDTEEGRMLRSDLEAALEAADLDLSETPVLWAVERVADPLSDVSLFVESASDPRYVAGDSLAPAGVSGEVLVFDGGDLLPCERYTGRVSARATAPETGDTRHLESTPGDVLLPCLAVDAALETVPVPGCGETPQSRRTVLLEPTSFDGVELRLLTLAVDDPGDVVFNVNGPVSGETYSTEVETADLAEGSHTLYARLTNGDGAEALTVGNLVVDRSAPQVEHTAPAPGSRLCGVPDGSGSRVVTVDGLAEDLGRGDPRTELQLREADGTWPDFGTRTVEPGGFGGSGLRDGAPPVPLEQKTVELTEEIADRAGTLTARWVATDAGALRSCTEPVSFVFDGVVEGVAAAVDRDLISPDGDGVRETVRISLSAGEAVATDVRVHAGSEEQALFGGVTVEPEGPSLRTLATGLDAAGGTSLSWDGRDDGGVTVPDGLYAVVVELTDGCGNAERRVLGVRVDTRPPQVRIHAPLSGVELPLMAEVIGSVDDPSLLDYTVDHGVGSEPLTWATLAQHGDVRASEEQIALWNTYGLEGEHTLRIRARDRAGHAATDVVTLTLPASESVITALQAVPDLISPNGDGRRDAASLRVGFAAEVTVTVEVVDGAGSTVRTVAEDEAFPEGSATLGWDGRDDAGAAVPDGEYRVRLRATATESDSGTQDETVPITVDATEPTLEITRPSGGFAAGSGAVEGTVTDPHLAEYTVSITTTPDAPDWRELARGHTEPGTGELGSLEGLEEGDWALRLRASDAAGNRAERIVAFEIDNTPPEAELTAPAAGSVVGAAAGAVTVRGTSTEEHPKSWSLELGAGDVPTSWTVVAAGDGLPADGAIAEWLPGAIADGAYTLRLLVEDRAGLTGESRVGIVVDGTAPAVAITEPPADGWITGPGPVTGTATDPHLRAYRLELAAEGSSRWSVLGGGAAPVAGGVLVSLSSLPPDGAYRLRLSAEDRAGNVAATTIPVRIDTRPPAAPAGLFASLSEDREVHLGWQPNGEADLAGYHVQRDGVRLTEAPLTSSAFVDSSGDDGTFVYTVTALDRAGLESEPSAGAEIVRDTTPPTTSIEQPGPGSRVGGLVTIVGTATSSDLKEYRLTAAPVDGSAETRLLRRSPVPARSETLTRWDTTGLTEGAAYTLRLEAEDLRDNVGTAEIAVTLDNRAPATPSGLTATVTGTDVEIAWDANGESDLAGYLLYRDGRLVHGAGDDLIARALEGTAFTDASLPDGTFEYRVAAIDGAGNLSARSAPVAVTLDERSPHAVIVDPPEGERFDKTLYVLAEIKDRDVAELRFQVRAAAETVWTDVSVDDAAPWETSWDPSGRDYGDYEIRAVATDDGGKTDPEPSPVTVTFTDLTRPAPSRGLAATVDGGEVQLTWDANSENDLAGYHVLRSAVTGSAVRVTTEPVTEARFTDSGVPDDRYDYRVVAVDVYGNEADPSASAEARVYTPTLERPLSPTTDLSADLTGTAEPGSTVKPQVVRPSGTEVLPPLTADAEGRFAVPGVALERGANELAAVATAPDGDRSKRGAVTVVSGVPPAAPTGLEATVTDGVVELSWAPSPEPDVLGYRVFVDGRVIPRDAGIFGLGAAASSSSSSSSGPAEAVDGRDYTGWSPSPDQPLDGQWLAARWIDTRLVSEVEVLWASSSRRAVDYDVQVWRDGGWLTLFEVRGNTEDRTVHAPSDVYPTDRVRVLLHSIAGDPAQEGAVELAEVSVRHRPLIAGPPESFSLFDGLHAAEVTAVSELGFESDPSATLEIPVGDAEPPPPVTLSAGVEGPDVTLTWTESTASDLAYYEIVRDGVLIAWHDDLANRSFVDTGLANGTYSYVVRPVDRVRNVGDPSNAVEVTVDVPPPPAPVDLVVTDPGTGHLLELAWSPGGESPAGGYRVLRSTTSGGPYDEIARTSEAVHSDYGVEAGVTYFYVVEALDERGSASAPSNEASGTPQDRVGPVAVLHHPGFPGAPFETGRTTQDVIVGTTEPGASVTVAHSGATIGTATASDSLRTATVDEELYGWTRPSPSGRRLWLEGSLGNVIVDLDTGEVNPAPQTEGAVIPRWLPDGSGMLFARYDGDLGKDLLQLYRLAGPSVEELTALDTVDGVAPGPHGRRAAVLGSEGGLSGLLLVDLATGEVTELVAGESYRFEELSVEWSPDGTSIAYRGGGFRSPLEAVEVATGAVITVTDDPGDPGYGSWSPDGSSIAYTAGTAGWDQVWTLDVATGETRQITDGSADHSLPRWSPDGRSVAYVRDQEVVEIRDLRTGETETVHRLTSWWDELEWVRGGRIFLTDDATPVRLTPPGRFAVRDIPLRVGENPFTARATDADGKQGELSEPMVIVVSGDRLADLQVSSLEVLPEVALTGETVSVTAAVTNTGESEAVGVELDLLLEEPSGGVRTVAGRIDLGTLAPGARRAVSRDVLLDAAGRFGVIANADPRDRVAEGDEEDNRARIDIPVLSEPTVGLAVTTGRDSYGPDEEVRVLAELFNAGPDFSGDLAVRIEDTGGFEVETLDPVPVDVASGSVVTEPVPWKTGSVFAGSYRAVARLLDASGTRVAEASAPFEIARQARVTATVGTDRPTYPAGATVRIEGRVRYESGNGPLSDAEARVRVLDGAGTVEEEWIEPLGDLLPGSAGTVAVDWPSGGSPGGTYRVRFEVVRAGAVTAGAETFFDLGVAEGGLSGNLTLASTAPALGEPLEVAYDLTNGTADDLLDLPVRLEILDPESGTVLAEEELVLDLDTGESVSSQTSLATAALSFDDYLVALRADVPVQEGSVETATLALQGFTPVDAAPPEVEVREPAAGAVLGVSDVAWRARVVDEHSTVEQVEIRLDGGSWVAATLESSSEGLWSAEFTDLSEGAHRLEARATDDWSNEANAAPVDFTVDTTPPEISVAGVEDGGSYPEPVTPTVDIVDSNLDETVLTLNGEPFPSGSEVADDGIYTLRVEAVDLAGNRSERTVEFRIGAGEPELAASLVDALAADADGGGVPSPGDELGYTLEIANTGGAPATAVSVRDLPPESTAVVTGSVATTHGTVVTEEPVEVAVGELPAGETARVTFRLAVSDPVPAGYDRVSNQATVTSAELPALPSDDPDLGGATDPTTTMITAAPELVAELTDRLADDADGDGVPSPGDVLAYRATVRNVGNTSATGVGLAVPVPEHGAVLPGSVETDAGTVDSEDPVVVTLGEVRGADSAEIRFRVRIDDPIAAGVREVSAQGLVVSEELADGVTDDPDVGGDTDATVTEVSAEPVLRAEKTAVLFDDADGDGQVSPGDLLLYRIALFNTGNTPATDVALTDPIPEDTLLEPDSLQVSGGTVEGEAPIRVAVRSLPVGAEPVVSFRVRIADPFPIDEIAVSNQGSVASAELEPVATDDPSTPEADDATRTPVYITPEIAVTDASAREGSDAVALEATLSEPGNRPVAVRYATADGSARTDRDYVATSGGLVFEPGETSATVSVELLDDALDELDEVFTLVLSGAEGGALADAEARVTVLDDDPPPVTAVGDVTVREGDDGATEALFAVELSAPSGLGIQVDHATADGSALAGADYTAVSGTVTIPAGSTSGTVAVPILGDLLDEADETFELVLSNPVNVLLPDASAAATILDDDPPPEMSVRDASVIEGDSDTTAADFAVVLSVPSGRPVSVEYATQDGEAEAGVDYSEVSGTLDIPPGTTTRTVSVPVRGDVVDELDEDFQLTLSTPRFAELVRPVATGTVVDDDEALISITDVTVDEGDDGTANAPFGVELATPADREITVEHATVAGSATAGEDFEPVSGTLVFPAGETRGTVSVPVVGDVLLEPLEETFTVELSNPGETEIEDGRALGTIVDDEVCPGPNLLANPGAEERPVEGDLPAWVEVEGGDWHQRFAEPEPADGEAYFASGESELGELAQDVSVRSYAVRIDAAAGQRFRFTGRVRTLEEDLSDTARIVVEYRDRADEVVLDAFDTGEVESPLEWRAVEDVRTAPAGTGWIRVRLIATRFTGPANDGYFDALELRSLRAPTLGVGDVAVYEGDAGSTEVRFPVRLACPFHREVRVDWATADGTALAGEDYTAAAGQLTFPVGDTAREVPVEVLGDAIHERHETFTLELSDLEPADDAVLLDPHGLGVITNDDFCARSHGFWKNHLDLWPTDWLMIGGVEYATAGLEDLLNYHGPDGSHHLALQLVATKLNLLVGSDPAILATVEGADTFLAEHPPGSRPKKDLKREANRIKDRLDAYNNPSCEETPVIPEGDDG